MQKDQIIERNFKEIYPEMTLGELVHDGISQSNRNLFPVINHEGALGIVLLDDAFYYVRHETIR